MTADLEPPTPAAGIPDCDVCGESLDDHDRCEGPGARSMSDLLNRLRALSPQEAHVVLSFLSGYRPDAVEVALDHLATFPPFAASPPAVGRGDDAPAPVPPAGAGAEPEAVTS